MRIIAKSTLREFWDKRPDCKEQLKAWHRDVKAADWRSPPEVKAQFGNASILKNGRVVFNICGNKYRLITWINFDFKVVYIRFIGAHKEYDRVNAETI